MKASVSVEEAIATVCRSNLPTVLTEGKDDYIVYRKIERRLNDLGISLMPVGGKDSVIKIWRGVKMRGANVLAIVDKDLWIYSGVPNGFDKTFITTNGYSIENDIYNDGNVEYLLNNEEIDQFRDNILVICEWFEGVVKNVMGGG